MTVSFSSAIPQTSTLPLILFELYCCTFIGGMKPTTPKSFSSQSVHPIPFVNARGGGEEE